jgi:3-oxoadipate enol-lactonase
VSVARLHHELRGPAGAPVVVLANSLGTTTALWDRQLPALEPRFRVLRFDHRGHGGSEVPPGPYTIDDLGRDALGLLDTLRIRRASFCGTSLGGMVGIWLAANAPERIERLALCCTSAFVGPGPGYAARAERVRTEGIAPIAEQVVARWFTPAFREREAATVARFTAMLEATPAEGYAGCCEALETMDLRPALPCVAAPTLVLAGADDAALPPAGHAAPLAAGIAGARLVVVPGAAHLAGVEAPGQVNRVLLEHLEG